MTKSINKNMTISNLAWQQDLKILVMHVCQCHGKLRQFQAIVW